MAVALIKLHGLQPRGLQSVQPQRSQKGGCFAHQIFHSAHVIPSRAASFLGVLVLVIPRWLSLPTLHLGPAWLHLGWAPFPLADSPSAYVWGKKTPAVSRVQGVNLQRSPQRRPLSNNQNLQSPRPSLVSFIEAAVVVAQEGVKAIAFTVGGSALAPPFRPAEAQRRS